MQRSVRINPQWRVEIASRLREARLACGKSQMMLALDTGLAIDTIRKVEQKGRMPDLRTLILWCLACGRPAWVVLEGIA